MSFSTTAVRSVAVPGLLLLLALAAALSLTIGAKSLPIGTVFTAFSGTCQSADCTIVLDARLPRTLAGLLAGVALGLAGALMQTLTRNPLADPGLLGVNSGASFAIVLGAALFGITSPQEQLLLAFCGALCASLLVAFTGSQGGGQLSPVRLTLAGVALAAVLEGLSNGIALLNPDVYDQLRFWQAGSLDIRTLQTLKIVLLPVVVAGIAALLLSRALNSLSLGNDTATALGSRVARTQLIGLIVITVLCGSATAVVGPIAFIGLMMPHMARWLVGADHRWSLPVTLLATPALLLFADVIGRLLVPGELRVSVVSAFLGAPVLIWLVRRQPREVACDCSVPPPDSQLPAADGRQPADFSARAGARPGAPDD
ncbi:ferric enterobactin transport system permease FepD [Klebsiella pneumoniae]|nr:ferric enterobactin transport system permease FepD [Klebsiella pneumoniae]